LVNYNTKKNKNNPYFYLGHIRIFNRNLNRNDLKWHRDKGDRYIKIIKGKGWFLQFDDDTPKELIPGKIYKINSCKYHRLLRSSDEDLKIKIFI
jgi:hypothetical protein